VVTAVPIDPVLVAGPLLPAELVPGLEPVLLLPVPVELAGAVEAVLLLPPAAEFTVLVAVPTTVVTVEVTPEVAPPVTPPRSWPTPLVAAHSALVAAESRPPPLLQVLDDWLASAWLSVAPAIPTATKAAGMTAIR
jgi:hypothetical protein